MPPASPTRHSRTHLAAALLVAVAALLVLVACSDDARPDTPPLVDLERAFGGREFERPIEVGAYPGGRMLVAEQDGLVHVLAPDGGDASTLIDLLELVDATSGREGLLSVALDPAFEANGYLWAYYFATGEPARTVLARFDVAEDRGDAASVVVVLEVPQPGGNQNGGAIRFGPDGMLYSAWAMAAPPSTRSRTGRT